MPKSIGRRLTAIDNQRQKLNGELKAIGVIATCCWRKKSSTQLSRQEQRQKLELEAEIKRLAEVFNIPWLFLLGRDLYTRPIASLDQPQKLSIARQLGLVALKLKALDGKISATRIAMYQDVLQLLKELCPEIFRDDQNLSAAFRELWGLKLRPVVMTNVNHILDAEMQPDTEVNAGVSFCLESFFSSIEDEHYWRHHIKDSLVTVSGGFLTGTQKFAQMVVNSLVRPNESAGEQVATIAKALIFKEMQQTDCCGAVTQFLLDSGGEIGFTTGSTVSGGATDIGNSTGDVANQTGHAVSNKSSQATAVVHTNAHHVFSFNFGCIDALSYLLLFGTPTLFTYLKSIRNMVRGSHHSRHYQFKLVCGDLTEAQRETITKGEVVALIRKGQADSYQYAICFRNQAGAAEEKTIAAPDDIGFLQTLPFTEQEVLTLTDGGQIATAKTMAVNCGATKSHSFLLRSIESIFKPNPYNADATRRKRLGAVQDLVVMSTLGAGMCALGLFLGLMLGMVGSIGGPLTAAVFCVLGIYLGNKLSKWHRNRREKKKYGMTYPEKYVLKHAEFKKLVDEKNPIPVDPAKDEHAMVLKNVLAYRTVAQHQYHLVKQAREAKQTELAHHGLFGGWNSAKQKKRNRARRLQGSLGGGLTWYARQFGGWRPKRLYRDKDACQQRDEALAELRMMRVQASC